MLRGTYRQAHPQGRQGLELCLYDATMQQAQVADDDRLLSR